MTQLALTYAPDTFDLRGKVMGRQSAGLGFLRATLDARPDRIWCYAASRRHAEIFGRDVANLTSRPPEIRFIPWERPDRLAQAGLLYRPDPGIADEAWRRRHCKNDRSYSICGITHSISSHAAMSAIAALLRSPLYPWDALISTSTVARDVVRKILEREMENLQQRLGATRFTLPSLPLIPLGIHVKDFVRSAEAEYTARSRIESNSEEIIVLFAGRLSFHGKAHPFSMFRSLEAAALKTKKKIRLLLFGQFHHRDVQDVFLEEARKFMPTVKISTMDGSVEDNKKYAWSAADIFVSLSDNIQETFGLTPLEAMASGIPVVVSDWNGYRDTVRDGIDGIRIRTVLPGPGTGADLADRYGLNIDDYDRYIGSASLFTSVSVSDATQAFVDLFESSDLRHKMGAAGLRRATENYDWSVIFKRYLALWDELSEARRAHPSVYGEKILQLRADRMDPFTLFSSYATEILDMNTCLELAENADFEKVIAIRSLRSVSYANAVIPSSQAIADAFDALKKYNYLSVLRLGEVLNEDDPSKAMRLAAWLLKFGVLNIKSSGN